MPRLQPTGTKRYGPQRGRRWAPTNYLQIYIHVSHYLCSSTSATSCKESYVIRRGKVSDRYSGDRALHGQDFFVFAAALAAWSSIALPCETVSFDLVCASHLTTAINVGNWQASNRLPISLPCLMGVPEDVMNPRFSHCVPKLCKHPEAYLESV